MKNQKKLVSAIMKNQKMALAPQKHVLKQNFQLPTPLKFRSPVFLVLIHKENWCYEKSEKLL